MAEIVRYYRNKVEVKEVDPECIWKLNGTMLELVDDDQYIAVSFDEFSEMFYEVSN